MRKNNKRSAILTAALHVVEEKGARHLTLDAVAARSGISKGGLLYHFASKQALLDGMLQHLVETGQQRIADIKVSQLGGNALSAILRANEKMTIAEKRASLALLAAAAENAELLDPAREYYAKLFSEITGDSSDKLAATVLMLAGEGMRFLDILDINPLARKQKADIEKYMISQAEQL